MSTYYVRKSGNDSNGGTDPDTDAKLTIASAISVSDDSDTIDIGEGSFSEAVGDGWSLTMQGAGMYKTFVTDSTDGQRWSGETITFKDINWALTSASQFGGGYGITPSNITFEDSVFDLSGFTNAIANFCYEPSTGSRQWHIIRSLFIGNASFTSTCTYFFRWNNSGMTLEVEDSLFYNCYKTYLVGDFADDPYSNITMRNTIVANFSGSANDICTGGNAWGTEEYNCFYFDGLTVDKVPNGAVGTGTIVDQNPLFVDAEGKDFRLQASSPCIGAGHA